MLADEKDARTAGSMFWIVIAGFLIAAPAAARQPAGEFVAQLPPASGPVGAIRRGPDGRLVPGEPEDAPAVPASHAAPTSVRERNRSGDSGRPDAELRCADGAVTCVELYNPGEISRIVDAVTFGQPFRRGDIPKNAGVVVRMPDGTELETQIDQPALFGDGSLRFAIISVRVGPAQPGERIVLSLFKGPNRPPASDLRHEIERIVQSRSDIEIELSDYVPQRVALDFTAWDTGLDGRLQAGDLITIEISAENRVERHEVRVDAALAAKRTPLSPEIADRLRHSFDRGGSYRSYRRPEHPGSLIVTPREWPGAPFTIQASSSRGITVAQRVLTQHRRERRYVSRLQSALGAHAASRSSLWLSGPVTAEVTASAPFLDAGTGEPHPYLTAQFNVRMARSGAVAGADIAVENTWAFGPPPRNVAYDVVVRAWGKTLYEKRQLDHRAYTRWRRKLPADSAPEIHIRHERRYLKQTGAIPPYDDRIVVPEHVIKDEYASLRKADTHPLGPAMIEPYMPQTGGRPDIGLLPRWTALYLVSMDPRAMAVMLANADAAGSAPVHARDVQTSLPVSLDRRPSATMEYGRRNAADVLPSVESYGATPWKPDSAHQPSLSYVPYLLTGDAFHLDELHFWANWNMLRLDPAYRGGKKGLLWPDQLRGQAWSLRTLAHAATITPERHPLKRYFEDKLQENLIWYVQRYARNKDPDESPLLGWMTGADRRDTAAAWQNDMMSVVLAHMSALAIDGAREVLEWNARFVIGRWTNEGSGYCRAMGPSYWLRVRPSPTAAPYATWRDLFRANWPEVSNCPPAGSFVDGSYPSSPTGYAAIWRGALAMVADAGLPGARQAFDELAAQTPAITAAYSSDPTWAFRPR